MRPQPPTPHAQPRTCARISGTRTYTNPSASNGARRREIKFATEIQFMCEFQLFHTKKPKNTSKHKGRMRRAHIGRLSICHTAARCKATRCAVEQCGTFLPRSRNIIYYCRLHVEFLLFIFLLRVYISFCNATYLHILTAWPRDGLY